MITGANWSCEVWGSLNRSLFGMFQLMKPKWNKKVVILSNTKHTIFSLWRDSLRPPRRIRSNFHNKRTEVRRLVQVSFRAYESFCWVRRRIGGAITAVVNAYLYGGLFWEANWLICATRLPPPKAAKSFKKGLRTSWDLRNENSGIIQKWF